MALKDFLKDKKKMCALALGTLALASVGQTISMVYLSQKTKANIEQLTVQVQNLTEKFQKSLMINNYLLGEIAARVAFGDEIIARLKDDLYGMKRVVKIIHLKDLVRGEDWVIAQGLVRMVEAKLKELEKVYAEVKDLPLAKILAAGVKKIKDKNGITEKVVVVIDMSKVLELDPAELNEELRKLNYYNALINDVMLRFSDAWGALGKTGEFEEKPIK
jgi:hypothetical protein